jgi:hypothetical protein
MPMPNLRSRVATLERLLAPPQPLVSKPRSTMDDEVMRLAEANLSEEDRQICERILEETDRGYKLVERECQAVCAYLAAIGTECERAGYSSIDEFQDSYCGAA